MGERMWVDMSRDDLLAKLPVRVDPFSRSLIDLIYSKYLRLLQFYICYSSQGRVESFRARGIGLRDRIPFHLCGEN